MILVVDDDPGVRRLVQTTLELDEWASLTAATAEEALQILKERDDIQVALLDLKMEGMGGMGFLDRYRDIRPMVQVVVITGVPSQETTREALRGGVDALAVEYLVKPVRREELLALVNRLVKELTAGRFVMDLRENTVTFAGEEVDLTPQEFKVFHVFMRWPNKRMPYEEIARKAYGQEMTANKARSSLRAHLSRLHGKLREATGRDEVFNTVAGEGIIFLPENAQER